ncbi:phosphoribosylglycinamide formyltransferase [Mailhella massiliensis]|uniref:Phosphoribosylglycinamide formyltransferase n=1 Tax=Mailhella massiliensis TaxID=1903261 RepID=A0A921DQZ1_9BACT|nr:phosphoribosylglycinamide formyltransferase [Mailhella massiliensis]HJD97069.1 phosphoribosylglycinamide formyltransferase [Mailhella massiliensis]
MTLKLGILASGSGTNAQAIIDAAKAGRLDADIRIVISNRPGAKVLERAEKSGIPSLCLDHKTFPDRESFDARMVEALLSAGVDTVALAGYMRLVTPVFLDAFPNRVLNIHPAVLPAFPGTHGARDAWIYGAKFSGCTVHVVDPVMDGGPVIVQATLPIRQEEDDEALLNRIHVFEHRIYVQALEWLAEGRLHLDGRRMLLAPAGKALAPQPELALIWPPLEEGF